MSTIKILLVKLGDSYTLFKFLVVNWRRGLGVEVMHTIKLELSSKTLKRALNPGSFDFGLNQTDFWKMHLKTTFNLIAGKKLASIHSDVMTMFVRA